MARLSIEERMALYSMPEPNSGCTLWTGAASKNGYGEIFYLGRVRHSHQVAYELARGAIPSGLCVCHKCDMPLCVNPDHLFLGTHKDNSDDKLRKGRARHASGLANGRAKLSNDDVAAIRISSEVAALIAQRFNISPHTVYAIRSGKRRRPLDTGSAALLKPPSNPKRCLPDAHPSAFGRSLHAQQHEGIHGREAVNVCRREGNVSRTTG